MRASSHLRGLVIAGVLAAVALALAGVTFAMNHSTSPATPLASLSPTVKHAAGAAPTTKAAVKHRKTVVKHKPPDPNFVAALKAGLPRSIASALAAHRVAVVSLTSAEDPVAVMAALEAHAGARLAGASFVQVSVDRNGGDMSTLTGIIGSLPVAPATLIYVRPATLVATMPGFFDRTIVQQAAMNAGLLSAQAAVAAAAATAAATAATTTTTPATPVAPAVPPVASTD